MRRQIWAILWNKEKNIEKENVTCDQPDKAIDSQLSKEVNLVINDITGYATKSRRNLVDNNSKIVQNNLTFLQEMNTEDDLLCNTEINEESNWKSDKGISIIERKVSTLSQGKPPSHPPKSITGSIATKWSNYEGKKNERTKLSKSPDMRPKWKGFGVVNNKSLVS